MTTLGAYDSIFTHRVTALRPTAADAAQCMYSLNRLARRSGDIQRRRNIYALKTRFIHALIFDGYCVGTELDNGLWLFSFIVENVLYQWHQPTTTLGLPRVEAFSQPLPDDVRHPTVTDGRYDDQMGTVRKYCRDRGY